MVSHIIPKLVYRTVSNGVIYNFLEDEKNFNLSRAINNVAYTYNNIRHKTIKYKPVYNNFYSSDKNLFSKIRKIQFK